MQQSAADSEAAQLIQQFKAIQQSTDNFDFAVHSQEIHQFVEETQGAVDWQHAVFENLVEDQ